MQINSSVINFALCRSVCSFLIIANPDSFIDTVKVSNDPLNGFQIWGPGSSGTEQSSRKGLIMKVFEVSTLLKTIDHIALFTLLWYCSRNKRKSLFDCCKHPRPSETIPRFHKYVPVWPYYFIVILDEFILMLLFWSQYVIGTLSNENNCTKRFCGFQPRVYIVYLQWV